MAGTIESFRPASRRVAGRAFTFVEILATLVLLSIVLPAVMSGISLALSAGDVAKRQAQAASLAQGKLMELLAEGQGQQTNMAGDFGTDWPEYRWTAQVSDWEGSVLRQLDVTVSWRYHGKDRDVTLSTLVYAGAGGGT